MQLDQLAIKEEIDHWLTYVAHRVSGEHVTPDEPAVSGKEWDRFR